MLATELVEVGTGIRTGRIRLLGAMERWDRGLGGLLLLLAADYPGAILQPSLLKKVRL